MKLLKKVNKLLKKLGFSRKQRTKAEFKLFKSDIPGKAGVVIDVPLGKNAD